MINNILLAAALTLSVFAAANAQAAAGHADQARFASAGGSYGFNIYPRCTPSQMQSPYCKQVCRGLSPTYCGISYRSIPKIEQRHRGNKTHGFAQGKFHSK